MESHSFLDFLQVFFTAKLFVLFVLIFFGMIGARSVSKKIVLYILLKTSGKHPFQLSEKRFETLIGLGANIGRGIVLLVIGMMVLDTVGIDIRPILAGAGVLGFAVGFGAQSLIKDFISGMFILLENQFSVGDRVKIGNFEGRVCALTARSTIIEDKNSARIYVQNGSISSVVNYSQRKQSIKAVEEKK